MNGKVAIITGSSSGIGEAIAVKLSSLGAHVIITGRDESRIDAVVKKCQSFGIQKQLAIGMRADLVVERDVKQLVNRTVETFGRIDILVNNAAYYEDMEFTDQQYIQLYDKFFDCNLKAIQLLTGLVIPYLVETNGSVVNISSDSSVIPDTLSPAYAMSKCALDLFTKCLALEMGPKGVRVNSVNPGTTRSPLLEKLGPNMMDYWIAHSAESYPLRRVGEPLDTAEAVAFLVNSNNTTGHSFITGAILRVDGGAVCQMH
ncbi:17-beta-hydroxysteroid dehydrogenase 14-like [Oppia nitens]|uniref:17-beta-hydroxysteroid dehydrogenase 14-like n=1 Tax=Oppia nitens TaxID=1686743 RepID=UPI0023DBD6DF|nr:17-beta-hydroxysteroid dehydrogenase 14-like [Oppia nitens]